MLQGLPWLSEVRSSILLLKSTHGLAKSKQIICARVGPKLSGLTYKSRAKCKMLQGIYIAIYGEVNVSGSVSVEIKGDYIEKQQSCFISVTLKS